MNSTANSQLAAAAAKLGELLASLETVAWSALAVETDTQPMVAQLQTVLADIETAIISADANRLRAAYVALNNLESRLPNTPRRGLGSQEPGQSTDPVWQELRANEVLDKLVALASPLEEPQARAGRKRSWWRREKR